LLPLVFQAIGQQRQVDRTASRAVARRVLLDGGQLVLVDHFRFVQQPPDERALAVVDAAAGDEPQQFLALVLRQILVNIGRDQGRLVRHP
jgi:Tfp pilus assembly protein FimV